MNGACTSVRIESSNQCCQLSRISSRQHLKSHMIALLFAFSKFQYINIPKLNEHLYLGVRYPIYLFSPAEPNFVEIQNPSICIIDSLNFNWQHWLVLPSVVWKYFPSKFEWKPARKSHDCHLVGEFLVYKYSKIKLASIWWLGLRYTNLFS